MCALRICIARRCHAQNRIILHTCAPLLIESISASATTQARARARASSGAARAFPIGACVTDYRGGGGGGGSCNEPGIDSATFRIIGLARRGSQYTSLANADAAARSLARQHLIEERPQARRGAKLALLRARPVCSRARADGALHARQKLNFDLATGARAHDDTQSVNQPIPRVREREREATRRLCQCFGRARTHARCAYVTRKRRASPH